MSGESGARESFEAELKLKKVDERGARRMHGVPFFLKCSSLLRYFHNVNCTTFRQLDSDSIEIPLMAVIRRPFIADIAWFVPMEPPKFGGL